MRENVRSAARRLLPALAANRAIRHERAVREHRGIPAIAERAFAKLGAEVLTGPFAGMLLPESFASLAAAPILKLAGVYEEPLHEAVERSVARNPLRIVNIGAADGYYAVGLALRCPDAEVLAYDIANEARLMTATLAKINHVTNRVQVHGRCRGFSSLTDLIVCDIEGSEEMLLRRKGIPDRAALIVETHDHVVPGITNEIVRRFARTHSVEVIPHRSPTLPSALDFLSREETAAAADEMRGDAVQSWVVAIPHPARMR